jgi:isopenicillin N synthase-like dioxygenase
MIPQVISEGLNLIEDEKKLNAHQHLDHNNQLRLLHYPPVPAEALETQIIARMPAHLDWR